MDNWIKALELELELMNDLIKQVQDSYSLPKDCSLIENVSYNCDFYNDLNKIATIQQRMVEQLALVKQHALFNPLWPALNFFMLNSCVDNTDLMGPAFEEARMNNQEIAKDSPLDQAITEIKHRINVSLLPRLQELSAYKERAHQPDIQALRKLLTL